MKVGFDISQIIHPGGVANYTKNLGSQLQQFKEVNMVFFFSAFRKSYHGPLKNVKKFRLPPTLFEVMFNRIRTVGIEKFIGPVDIYHSSDWVQPRTKAKTVTTYHDLVPLLYPKWSHPKIVSVNKIRLKLVEAEVDKVIAVSESTKNDLLSLSKLKPSQIEVIYEGVSEIFKPSEEKDQFELKKKYNLPDNFCLAIGGVGERKNLKRIKQASKGFNLITTMEDLPVLSDEELAILYSCADALIYTTLYEGFGLPIIEAMACGTPVLTSNVSSMPEIAGGAAVLTDPNDVDKIRRSLEDLLLDKQKQKDLILKGFKRAKDFSWEKTADKTLQVYKQLIK